MNAEWVAQRRSSAFEGRRRFGETTAERIANLSTYIGHQRLVSDWDSSPANLLAEIVRAASELPANLQSITDVARWKADVLIIRGEDGSIKGLRKPRLNLGFRETSRGNLRLDWWVDGDNSDFNYHERDFRHNPGYKDLSEILFIRKFEMMKMKIGQPASGNLEIDLRPVLADVAIGLVEETITSLRASFDVTLYRHFNLKRDESSQLVFYGILTAEEVKAKQIEEERRREEQRVDQLRDELAKWEAKHGIGPGRAVSAWEVMAAARMRIADRLDAMKRLGATLPDGQNALESSIKGVKAILAELNTETPPFDMSEIDGFDPRDTSGNQSIARGERLQDRIRSMVAPEQFTPPSYPIRTYDATASEPAYFGVVSVREMVVRMNEKLRESNQFPISTGDYPTNKAKFARLVRRWQAMDGYVVAEAAPAGPALSMR
ncbi:hypothetical protein HFO56_03210 [Rhizobium laguerreae]|uniref:hypothetical protein n=1 Tax=Rhizobium laguerreae TaxID=1076926 RepID=UPI001C908D33|nr:hypothetical protein [Rhizobium laguerreae]MBY3151396.1 hypothetical protein [Rhizobium laguerreae]